MMSYTVEEVNGCTKRFIFSFETLDLSVEINSAIAKKQKTVNMKGFRPGKAPLSVVQKMYGPQMETEALNQFVQRQFFEAVEEESLKVVGHPAFENMKYDSGKSVSFDALVEFFPVVKVNDFSGLNFERDVVFVSDEDLSGVRNNFLNSKSEMVVLEDAVLSKGHTAIMNFQGYDDKGVGQESMKGEDYSLELGSGQFIPGFEDQMLGMKKGEKRELKIKFPADYQAEELRDKEAKFDVEVLEIKEKKLPEFTDELAKEFGFESVEDFNDKNKKQLLSQKNKAADEKLHQEILEKLTADNSFDIPRKLVESQMEYMKEDVKKTLDQQGFTEVMMVEYFEKWQDDLEQKSEFQVRSGIILDTLSQEYNIEIKEEDFDKKLEAVAADSGMDTSQIKSYYDANEKIKKNMMYVLREEKTFDIIKEKITLSTKE